MRLDFCTVASNEISLIQGARDPHLPAHQTLQLTYVSILGDRSEEWQQARNTHAAQRWSRCPDLCVGDR